jgi:hypothetical protein
MNDRVFEERFAKLARFYDGQIGDIRSANLEVADRLREQGLQFDARIGDLRAEVARLEKTILLIGGAVKKLVEAQEITSRWIAARNEPPRGFLPVKQDEQQ